MHRILCASLLASLSLASCSDSDADLPAVYREMEIPTADRMASSDFQRQGRALFHEHCILCHGERANGQGVRAAAFQPPPMDLTSAAWQASLDDRHVYYVIAEGRRAAAMPSWKPTLSPREIWSVVAYLRSLGPLEPATRDSTSASGQAAPSAASGPRR